MTLTQEQMALLSDKGSDNICHVYLVCGFLVGRIPLEHSPDEIRGQV